ncbi:MAG: hypothetical protein ACOYOB_09940 [Myxococcota bacterium]
MTTAHLFYIPLVILLGTALGYFIGRKLLLAEQEEQRRLAERRARRQASDTPPAA